jgi:hypothetical protein
MPEKPIAIKSLTSPPPRPAKNPSAIETIATTHPETQNISPLVNRKRERVKREIDPLDI